MGTRMQPAELRAWRRRFGLTQKELAGYLGMPAMAISRWERGQNPTPAMLPMALVGVAATLGHYPYPSDREPQEQ